MGRQLQLDFHVLEIAYSRRPRKTGTLGVLMREKLLLQCSADSAASTGSVGSRGREEAHTAAWWQAD